MMYVLKDTKCECGCAMIVVRGYTDDKDDMSYVDGAACIECLKEYILPPEPLGPFINQHCRFVKEG